VTEVQRQAAALADRLFDDLKAGRLEKVGLGEIEAGAFRIVSPQMDPHLFRSLVNWTVRYLVEKAWKNERRDDADDLDPAQKAGADQ
jgi:hypothetical protein